MPGGADVRRSAVVVGRDTELALLRDCVQTAAGRQAGTVVLVGEGGVGKTRLLSEAVTAARQQGLAVFAARASVTAPHPLGAVTEALRSWLREHPRPPTGTPYDRGLRLVLPEWPADEGTGGAADLSEAQLRLLALEAVVRLVRDVATDTGGALVVLDDLHAFDPDSVEAARYLSAAAVPGVTVLIGMRPGEQPLADELLRTLEHDGVATAMPLAPLAAEAVASLVREISTAIPPEDLVEQIMHGTDGVPLLVEEVLAAHLRAGSVAVADGALVWHGEAVPVPSTVRDLAATRLDRLDPAERSVLVAGAVLGDFTPDLLSAVSRQVDVDGAVRAGVRVGLLEAGADGATFRHAIVRDAVLHAVGAQELRRLHRGAAQALAVHARGDARTAERRAAHLAAAGDDDAAAMLLAEAAHRRVRTHALLSAEALARDAVRLARDPATQSDASDSLARSLAAQGRWNEALAADAAAVEQHGDSAGRRHRMAMNALEAGRPELAGAIVRRARAAGDPSPSLELAAGRVALVGGDGDAALGCAERMLGATGADVDQRLAALELRGRALDFLGRRDEAELVWTQQADEALATGHTQAQLRALVHLGKVELFAGRPVRRLRDAVDLARQAGALVELAWAEENLAVALGVLGDTAGALAVLDEAIARCRALRLDQLAYLLAGRGIMTSYVESGPAAERWLTEAESLMPTDDLRLHTLGIRGDIALREARYDDAVAHLQTATRILQTMPGIVPSDCTCWLVLAHAAIGRGDEARAALASARALPDLDRWHGRRVILDAADAVLAGDSEQFDAVLDAVTTVMPMDLALLRMIAADLLAGEEAQRWLRTALETYTAAGALPAVDRVRRMLRAAGAPVPRTRTARGALPGPLARSGVTSREAEVLALVGEGLSNAEIAERLVLSVRTVESHVSALLTKLNAHRRGRLAALARELS